MSSEDINVEDDASTQPANDDQKSGGDAPSGLSPWNDFHFIYFLAFCFCFVFFFRKGLLLWTTLSLSKYIWLVHV